MNVIMGVLHAVQGTLMLVLGDLQFKLPVTTSFLKFDPVAQRLVSNVETRLELPLAGLVAAFLFMSAIAHLTVSLPGIHEWYLRNLGRGINIARWVEYSFSSSVMIVAIAMLFGMYDAALLLALFALNATMILFGWMMELHNQSTNRTNWTSFIFGCFAGAIPWVAVGIYFFGSLSGGERVPDFVYIIYGSLFLFFNVFAVNMVLQYRKVGRWSDYIYGERAYIILSLVAKSLLAWQVYAGTLQPV
jgi:hypothetical protein